MHIETATRLYEGFRNTRHEDLRHDLLRAAVTYAHLRAEWFLAATEQRADMDRRRTAAHNAVIDACNILSRQMAQTDESTDWRAALGSDRKTIGDFACYIALFAGLAAR